jgi:hypothetical protein
VRFSNPIAYQESGGERDYVQVAYEVHGDEYGFRVGQYDRGKELIIDPTLVSTFLGGNSDNERVTGIALDNAGDVYVTGTTESTDFPCISTSPSPANCAPGITPVDSTFVVSEAFVVKLNPSLSLFLYSTFLGGNYLDNDLSGLSGYIALDSTSLYFGDTTGSSDFPGVVPGSADVTFASSEAYVAKITINHPPDCSAASPSVSTLFSPNHEFHSIGVLGVTDPDGDPVTITINTIFQDEPTKGQGSGGTCRDAKGIGTSTAQVRAERSGSGNGRVYHISFTAVDGNGAICTGEVKVCVPLDGKKNTCIDGGALYDSTKC